MHIHIATPMYGGSCKAIYVQSLMATISDLPKNGHSVSYSITANESLITRARNHMARIFMEETSADYLLFLDADQGWVSTDILRMIESKKQLIGGAYPIKMIDWQTLAVAHDLNLDENMFDITSRYPINFLEEEPDFSKIDINQPLEIEGIGTGMMLIHRSVFEELKSICRTYTDFDLISGKQIEVTDYFSTDIDPKTNSLLGEDLSFCNKWRSLGNKVYAALWTKTAHAGDYVFGGNFEKFVEINKQIKKLEKNK